MESSVSHLNADYIAALAVQARQGFIGRYCTLTLREDSSEFQTAVPLLRASVYRLAAIVVSRSWAIVLFSGIDSTNRAPIFSNIQFPKHTSVKASLKCQAFNKYMG
jgi:hypothetical protein